MSEFEATDRNHSLVKLATADGMLPPKLLIPKCRVTKFVMLPIESGIVPLKEFELFTNFFRLAIAEGMDPTNRLEFTAKVLRLLAPPIDAGMLPEIRLKHRSKCCNVLRFPIELGMLPMRQLLAMLRNTRLLRL